MNITFTSITEIPEEYAPKPASKVIPDWYKNLESYINNSKVPTGANTTPATVKKCMPVFDSITAGYILFTPAEVYVSQVDGQPYYEWVNYGLIEFHSKIQAPNHPNRNGLESYPKWINHWGIKTPKGYSCLFIPPVHRESVFSILPGIVDTDTYTNPINFPFVLNDPKFEGYIPAGTPIAQIIPFKRESWEMNFGGQNELIEINKVTSKLQTKFFDKYKTMFRSSKEYK